MNKKNLMNNVFKLEDIKELLDILDVSVVFDSDQLIFNGTIDYIIEELAYNGFDISTVVKNTTNDGFGYSFWELYYIKNVDEYYLINNLI